MCLFCVPFHKKKKKKKPPAFLSSEPTCQPLKSGGCIRPSKVLENLSRKKKYWNCLPSKSSIGTTVFTRFEVSFDRKFSRKELRESLKHPKVNFEKKYFLRGCCGSYLPNLYLVPPFSLNLRFHPMENFTFYVAAAAPAFRGFIVKIYGGMVTLDKACDFGACLSACLPVDSRVDYESA